MRVALVTRSENRVTGLSRYSKTLLRYLDRTGIDVHVGTIRTPIPAPLTHAARRIGLDCDAFFTSYPVMGDFGPADIYHLTSESLATLLPVRRLRPSIVTVHAFFTWVLRNDPQLAMYDHVVHRWFDLLAARGLQRADAIIAVSEYVKSTLVEALGIPADRIHVVPEAVDHSHFKPLDVSDEFRERYHLSPDSRYILYVGSEQPRKNFLMLLRAFARLRQRCDDIRLLKIGQPEIQGERQKAMQLIEELGIADSVIFAGHVGQNLPLLYNASHVFVFPSLFEGFGFPPLEAMACGTPVICSNTTSLPEVVGDAALLFDPTDEEELVDRLEVMLRDDELRSEYRRRGLLNAQRFNWELTAQRTVDVYRRVIPDVHEYSVRMEYGDIKQ